MTSRPFISWQRLVISLSSLCVIFFVFGWLKQGYEFQKTLDRKILDGIILAGGGAEEREDFVLLGIDEASLSADSFSEEEIETSEALKLMGGRWPWDRRVWAEAIDKLCGAGAKLVVLDLMFAEPGTPEEDEALAASIARYPEKVVLAGAFSPIGQQEDGHLIYTFVEPYVQFLESDPEPRIGFVNFWADPEDNTIRSARFRSSVRKESNLNHAGDYEHVSIAAQIMDVYGVEIPDEDQHIRFTSQSLVSKKGSSKDLYGSEVYRPHSVARIFSDAYWKNNYDSGAFFKDKVVMIGSVAERFQDMHKTPVGIIPGPQLHLQVAACGLEGAFITHFGHPWAMMWLMGLLVTFIAAWFEKPRWSALAFVLLLSVYVLTVWLMATHRNVMIPVVGGVIAATAAWVASMIYQLIRERLEKGRIRGSFRRFVSRDVVDRLVDQPEAWAEIAAGRKRTVVVLFSDVRGFTSRSETAEPTELVGQLNEYFSAMVAIVFRHKGTLDKFIGDAVMAHWGAIDDASDEDHARAALAAAKEMKEELAALNKAWEKKGWKPFQVGIGVHLGEAVSGEIGSDDRIEFSVIGDAVNLASRLEGLTKAFHCDIVFSDTVQQAAKPEEAIPLGKVRVKGRSGAVELYGYGDEKKIEQALASMKRDAEGAIVMKSK